MRAFEGARAPVSSGSSSAAIDDLFAKRIAALHAKREAEQLEARAVRNATCARNDSY